VLVPKAQWMRGRRGGEWENGRMGEWEWKLVEVSEVKDYVSKGIC